MLTFEGEVDLLAVDDEEAADAGDVGRGDPTVGEVGDVTPAHSSEAYACVVSIHAVEPLLNA